MHNNYLITGGAGFIGSHLSEKLLALGANVTIIDDLSTGCWENIAALESHPNFRAIIASVDDERLMHDEVPKVRFVYHLASAVGVKLVIEKPVETVQRIVRGTDIVVSACSKFRRPVLLSSTSEVYGKSERIPFSEDDDIVMGATSKRRWAYACAKSLDEFLVLAHFYQTLLPVYIVRLFNTVGPRQASQYGMVLPRFVDAALENRPLQVYGNGEQTRCFCSVFDVVRGLIALSNCREAVGQVVNLGSNEEVGMTELAQRVIALSGSQSMIEYVPYEQAYGPGFDDMQRRVPNMARAQTLIGWQPEHNLDAIILQVIEDRKDRWKEKEV
ncbi:MAG: GDP-mannose 4,6-dehydratase [Planctomycetaceae bacterium]|nr:GDP-mannose 4,6-dehydratase [Planctomycetaceae bacterium]